MTQGVPLPLTVNVKLNHVLHDGCCWVAVQITETPRVPDEERAVVTPITDHVTRVELRFGFMEKVDVPGDWPAPWSAGRQCVRSA